VEETSEAWGDIARRVIVVRGVSEISRSVRTTSARLATLDVATDGVAETISEHVHRRIKVAGPFFFDDEDGAVVHRDHGVGTARGVQIGSINILQSDHNTANTIRKMTEWTDYFFLGMFPNGGGELNVQTSDV